MAKNVHGYYKIGDIVKNESVWGDKLFEIHSLMGNSYSPRLLVCFLGKERNPKNTCLFPVSETKLISSNKRPLSKIKIDVLTKLIKAGNSEAKRELIMRSRKK